MKVAVVMPRGCAMSPDKPNSMEIVARSLAEHSRLKRSMKVICEAGHPSSTLDLLTVPGGLDRHAHTRAVEDALAAFDPDIIEYHQQIGPAETLARRFKSKINVLYRHTRIKPAEGVLDGLRYSRRLGAFDRLVFVSNAAAAEFSADYPAFAGRASVVANAVKVRDWAAPIQDREPLILFSGRAIHDKGLDTFCAALAQVLDANPGWRGALLLGEYDRSRDWAEPHVRALERFGDRVEIRQSVGTAEVVAVTRRAAIAVTPSRVPEALGLTALEAHASGAALISSGRGGLREVSGPHALYCDPDSADTLVEAMTRLIDKPALRLAMARSGQAHVSAAYAPASQSARLDDLREQLVSDQQQAVRRRAYRPAPATGALLPAGLFSRLAS